MKKAKKQNLIKVVVFALCLSFIAPLFSCANAITPVKNGIDVLPDKEITYSKETLEFAYSSLYAFGEKYFKLSAGKELSQKNAEKLSELVTAVRSFTLQENLKESVYLEFYSYLNDNSSNLSSAIYALDKGTSNQEQRSLIKRVLSKITSLWGAETTARIFYQTVLYYYDYKNQDYTEKFENYGLNVHKIEAEKAIRDKETLKESVGEQNFILAVKLFYFAQGLFFSDAFSQSVLGSFTPSEVLLFIKEPDFSALSMDSAGWRLILSFADVFISNGFYGDLFKEFESSGDLETFSNFTQQSLDLFLSVQNSFDEKQVEFLLSGNKKALISGAFNKFTDSEWQTFEEICSITLIGNYNKVGLEYYGNAYQEYLDDVTVYTLDAVKGEINSDNFTDLLMGYLAGICPALTYGRVL